MVQTTPRSGDGTQRQAVALFCSTLACFLALAYCLLRRGVPDVGWGMALQACGISLFVLHLPLFFGRLLRRDPQAYPPAWYRSEALVSLLGLAAVGAAGWLLSLIRFPFGYLFVVAGFVLFLLALLRWKRFGVIRAVFLVVAGSVFALCAAAVIWGTNCHYPLILEAISHNRLGVDVIYHAAIANMIKTHGVPSTGLEGPAYFHYAWASHWLIAQISRLLDQPVLECYQLVFPVVLFPYLVQALLHFALRLRELLAGEHPPQGLEAGGGWFWLLLFAGFWGFVPSAAAASAGLDVGNLCFSVSYVLVVALASHVLSLLLELGLAIKDRPTRLTVTESLFVVAVLPLLMALLTCCKVNGGFLVLGLLGYFFLRLGGYRSAPLCIALAGCVVTTYLTYKAVRPPKTTPMRLFAYWSERVAHDWEVLHLLLTWFWVLLYVFLRLASKGVAYLGDLKSAWKSKQILDVETLAVLALLGLAPCTVMDLGTSEFYLLDFQHWIALAFVLAGLPLFLDRLGLRRTPGVSWDHTPLCWVVGVVFALALSYGLFWRYCDEMSKFAENALACRGAPPEDLWTYRNLPWQKKLKTLSRIWRGRIPVVPGTGQGPDAGAPCCSVMSQLHQFERMPPERKRQTALFLPYTLGAYWGRVTTVSKATLAPCLTGLAMINGLPENPEVILGYGQTSYDYTKTRHLNPEKDSAEILRRAVSLGFSRVLVIEAGPDGAFQLSFLDNENAGDKDRDALVHGQE
jgi:hypothetical protein